MPRPIMPPQKCTVITRGLVSWNNNIIRGGRKEWKGRDAESKEDYRRALSREMHRWPSNVVRITMKSVSRFMISNSFSPEYLPSYTRTRFSVKLRGNAQVLVFETELHRSEKYLPIDLSMYTPIYKWLMFILKYAVMPFSNI